MGFTRSSVFQFAFLVSVCFISAHNLLHTNVAYKRYTRRKPTNYSPDKYLTEVYEIFYTKRQPPPYPFLTVGDLTKFLECDRRPELPDCEIFGSTERPQRTSTVPSKPGTTTTSSTTRVTTRRPATTSTTKAPTTTRTTTTTKAPTTTTTTTTTTEATTTTRSTTTARAATTSTKQPDIDLPPLLPDIPDDEIEDNGTNGSGDFGYEDENSDDEEAEDDTENGLYFTETTTTPVETSTPKRKGLFQWL